MPCGIELIDINRVSQNQLYVVTHAAKQAELHVVLDVIRMFLFF